MVQLQFKYFYIMIILADQNNHALQVNSKYLNIKSINIWWWKRNVRICVIY